MLRTDVDQALDDYRARRKSAATASWIAFAIVGSMAALLMKHRGRGVSDLAQAGVMVVALSCAAVAMVATFIILDRLFVAKAKARLQEARRACPTGEG